MPTSSSPFPNADSGFATTGRRAIPYAVLLAVAFWMLGEALLRWPAGSLPGADYALIHPAISAAAGGASPTNPMLFDIGTIFGFFGRISG